MGVTETPKHCWCGVTQQQKHIFWTDDKLCRSKIKYKCKYIYIRTEREQDWDGPESMMLKEMAPGGARRTLYRNGLVGRNRKYYKAICDHCRHLYSRSELHSLNIVCIKMDRLPKAISLQYNLVYTKVNWIIIINLMHSCFHYVLI